VLMFFVNFNTQWYTLTSQNVSVSLYDNRLVLVVEKKYHLTVQLDLTTKQQRY